MMFLHTLENQLDMNTDCSNELKKKSAKRLLELLIKAQSMSSYN